MGSFDTSVSGGLFSPCCVVTLGGSWGFLVVVVVVDTGFLPVVVVLLTGAVVVVVVMGFFTLLLDAKAATVTIITEMITIIAST